MNYNKKLVGIFEKINSGNFPFPKLLTQKHINYLSNANVVALIRSIKDGEKSQALAIKRLKAEIPVQKFLSAYSLDECAFIIASNI